MTTDNTTTITILKTSQRGAHLITDGIKVAWIMGRSRRADGTFTPAAYSALADGTPYEEWKAEEERRELWRTDREKARELLFQEGKKPVSIKVASDRVREGSEKSWKVRTNRMQWLYGKYVSVYEYLPKSQVSVDNDGTVATLTMPKWFLDKNSWLTAIEVA